MLQIKKKKNLNRHQVWYYYRRSQLSD